MSPFLGNLTRYPSFQSVGTFSSSRNFSNKGKDFLCTFSASAGILPGPEAFPFRSLKGVLTSSLVGFLQSIGRLYSAD